MRFILATGERLSGVLVQALLRAGHSVQGVIVPARSFLDEEVHAPFWRLGRWSLKRTCERHGVPLRFARFLDEGATQALIRQANPDLLLVMGWPTMIKEQSLALFRLGGMNIHPSLLPQMRGADPLFHALKNGIDHIGITYHRLTQQQDAGPVFLQIPLTISPGETYSHLYLRVIKLSASSLSKAIKVLTVRPEGVPQRGTVTRASTFRPGMQMVNFDMDAHELERLCRACFDHHRLRTDHDDEVIYVGRVTLLDRARDPLIPTGFIKRRTWLTMVVRAGDHWVALERLRVKGMPRITLPWFLRKHCVPGRRLRSHSPSIGYIG